MDQMIADFANLMIPLMLRNVLNQTMSGIEQSLPGPRLQRNQNLVLGSRGRHRGRHPNRFVHGTLRHRCLNFLPRKRRIRRHRAGRNHSRRLL
ncbi:CLUMA_CG009923, isoform A [Clunio marinus]|uniref:CLUMA_CG009923, isoform A n=1 Tax=Clunio marinus TaxID=568069 RepID=A0A1J1I8Y0_9DIPT|nr:CLUMA_CG009923, isoform A [Clunio marinus]